MHLIAPWQSNSMIYSIQSFNDTSYFILTPMHVLINSVKTRAFIPYVIFDENLTCAQVAIDCNRQMLQHTPITYFLRSLNP